MDLTFTKSEEPSIESRIKPIRGKGLRIVIGTTPRIMKRVLSLAEMLAMRLWRGATSFSVQEMKLSAVKSLWLLVSEFGVMTFS